MLLLVISIVCWQRLVTADAGFQSSKSSIYAFCWFALPLNMLIVDPSISAFTATFHHTWQSTYTFGRQFAAVVFVSLWVDGQRLLVDWQCLLVVYCALVDGPVVPECCHQLWHSDCNGTNLITTFEAWLIYCWAICYISFFSLTWCNIPVRNLGWANRRKRNKTTFCYMWAQKERENNTLLK